MPEKKNKDAFVVENKTLALRCAIFVRFRLVHLIAPLRNAAESDVLYLSSPFPSCTASGK